jgi:hypothetical protein
MFVLLAAYLFGSLQELDVSLEQASHIAEKIWYHESNHQPDQTNLMIFWNEVEPFPSIGIGHFIWPPESYQGPFTSGRFHRFIQFMKEKEVTIPKWLEESRYCPWETREEFYAAIHSDQMQELKDLLQNTTSYQALYMIERLKMFYEELIDTTDHLAIFHFHKMLATPQGLYILTDYLNFKHEGTNPQERYCNEGWGLLQVLQTMNLEEIPEPQSAFVTAAKRLLKNRTSHAPNPAMEALWLPNWFLRLDSYIERGLI